MIRRHDPPAESYTSCSDYENIWFLLLTCREKNALLFLLGNQEEEEEEENHHHHYVLSPLQVEALQFLHGLHRSVFITFGLIRTDTCVYTRQLPGWLAQVKENWPRPKCKKWRHLPPSLQFHFFFTKFINTDITILLATLMNFLFQRGAISEWFKRPTTVSVSSDCSRRLIYGRCSIQ